MGSLAFKAVSKKGKDKMATSYTSAFEIPVTDIKGHRSEKLGELVHGKKAVLIVNVASK